MDTIALFNLFLYVLPTRLQNDYHFRNQSKILSNNPVKIETATGIRGRYNVFSLLAPADGQAGSKLALFTFFNICKTI